MVIDKLQNGITLVNADNMEYMATITDKYFDLAIVDPPYGINFAKTQTGNGWVVRESKDWDKSIPPAEYFTELFRISKNQIIWGGNYFTHYLYPSMGWIFWDKGQRDFSLADGELAWTSFNKALRAYNFSRAKLNAQRCDHPTEKPFQLYDWIISQYAKQGDKIIDTHLGSGSIALAIDKSNNLDDMNLEFVGIELDEEYYHAAKKRIIQYQQQLTIF